ncbi:MAG: metal-dependent hydrolase [Ignavibacteriae bacterium]|nr:metal-dependent hydrolase [Ignavibacteriota bacterium]
MLKITYLSHSSFLLDDGTHQLVIDPFLTGNPNSPVKVSDIKAKFTVLTHAHGDHLGDGLTIEKGCKAHNMHIGGGRNFEFGRLKFTIAHHGSATQDGRYMGAPAGVIIKMGGKTVYHTGDTGLFLDMKLVGEIDKIDALFVPIGDNFTMGIDDAVRAVEFVNPELTVPMHYNTFPVIQADPEVFKSKLSANEKDCRVMKYGESITL